MDELVDAHFRAEAAGDVQAIADGFTADAEHDVAGRPGPPLRGGQQINNSSPPDHSRDSAAATLAILAALARASRLAGAYRRAIVAMSSVKSSTIAFVNVGRVSDTAAA